MPTDPSVKKEATQEEAIESTTDTTSGGIVETTRTPIEETTYVQHTVTEQDVLANPGEGLVEGETIGIPVGDIEISQDFAQALEHYHASLPKGHTVNVMADGFPQLEVISFDASIPNNPKHIENLRALLVRNDNVYGNHRRFVGTQEELIEQLNGTRK